VRTAAPDASVDGDVEYENGLREMIAACIGHGLENFERGRPSSKLVPPVVAEQVRRAASSGIGLATALRRCVAGYTCAWGFLFDEMNRIDLTDEQRHLLSLQASAMTGSMLELLQVEVASAHRREIERRAQTHEQRRSDMVHGILVGGAPDARERAELGYELDAWHLAIIATGADARKAARRLEVGLGCELLLVACSEQAVWAWLGAQRRLALSDIERVLSTPELRDVSLAVGGLREGLEGWRLTHREAQGAALVARHRAPSRLIRYADVAPEAAALQDAALADSLIGKYLSPLDELDIGGQTARRTLRALFGAEHNVSSAAHALNVHRSTVHRWRNEIEARLGCRLHEHQGDIEIALRVEGLHRHRKEKGASIASADSAL
jgi:hypothetical protein